MQTLSKAEITGVLNNNWLGTLSLVDGNTPYAIPMSYGYDDISSQLVMNWGQGEDGRKIEILETNPNASLTIFEHETGSSNIYRSVVLSGQIRKIHDDQVESAMRILANTAEIVNDFETWGVPIEEVDFLWTELDIEHATGREFGEAEVL